MYWREDEIDADVSATADVVDVLFTIEGKRVPVDHGWALGEAISQALGDYGSRGAIGVHTIHVAGSQNGWERPAHAEDQFLMLSRRTKLIVRAEKARAAQLKQALTGRLLDIAGCRIAVGIGKERPLSKETTQFARHVIDPIAEDEDAFLDWAVNALREIDVHVRKALCGKALHLATPDGPLLTRSLLLAKLDVKEALRLQQHGLGPHRGIGCGLFIPHKGIDAVRSSTH